MPIDLIVQARDERGATIVEIEGEIDVLTAPILRDRLGELIDKGHSRLVVDLEAVGFMGSEGLGVLVEAGERVTAHGGSMTLVCTNPPIVRVIEAAGLDQVFRVYPSVEACLSDTGGGSGRG